MKKRVTRFRMHQFLKLQQQKVSFLFCNLLLHHFSGHLCYKKIGHCSQSLPSILYSRANMFYYGTDIRT